MTIQQIQSAIDSKANDPRQLINMIADYLQANPGGSSPAGSSYLVYAFQVQQNDTDPLDVIVMENTLGGDVVWARDSAGYYIGTKAGAFLDDQFFALGFGTFSGSGNPFMPLWGESGDILGYLTLFHLNEDAIGIRVANSSGTLVDLSTLIGSTKIFLEVRVYQ